MLPAYNHGDQIQPRYPARGEARRGPVQQAAQGNAPQQQQQRPQPREGIASRTRNQLAARARNEDAALRRYNLHGPPERGRDGVHQLPVQPINRPDPFQDANGPVPRYHPEGVGMEDERMGFGIRENRGAGEIQEHHHPDRETPGPGNGACGFQGPGYQNQRRQSERLRQQRQNNVRLPRDDPRGPAVREAFQAVDRGALGDDRMAALRPDPAGDGSIARDFGIERPPRELRGHGWPDLVRDAHDFEIERLPRELRRREPWTPRRGLREH